MSNLLNIDELAFSGNNGEEVKEVNLTLNEPSLLLFVGKNEYITTIIAKLLAGLKKPDTGKITYRGYPIQEVKHKISYVSHDADLISNRSVRDNIVFKLRYHPEFNDFYEEDWIEDVLERFNLFEVRNQLPMNLSEQEKKNVVMARAVVSQPEFILVDQPGHNLGPMETMDLIDYLKTLNIDRDTTSIMFANRIYPECTVTDRILVLDNGTIDASGTLEEVSNHQLVENLIECQSLPD